jgi:protein arginine N-methyltransferase 1
MSYRAEEVWFAASLTVESWDEEFHQLMLGDRIRMAAYERAIKAVVRPGMAVVDLGTGTGILALWALQAGARVVHGIEVNEAILGRAVERIARAGLGDRFRPHRGLSGDARLPERVDVLISEILGNVADNEGMTPILADARARFLRPGGRMLPRRATSYLVPVSSPAAHRQIREGRCCGLSGRSDAPSPLSALGARDRFQLTYDVIIPARAHLATPAAAVRFAFDGSDPETYTRELSFLVEAQGVFTGFKGTFVAELAEGVVLDISSDDIEGGGTSDSWKHAYLPIEQPVPVRPGDLIALTFSRSRADSPFRQRYRWAGTVRRGDELLGRFENRLG